MNNHQVEMVAIVLEEEEETEVDAAEEIGEVMIEEDQQLLQLAVDMTTETIEEEEKHAMAQEAELEDEEAVDKITKTVEEPIKEQEAEAEDQSIQPHISGSIETKKDQLLKR